MEIRKYKDGVKFPCASSLSESLIYVLCSCSFREVVREKRWEIAKEGRIPENCCLGCCITYGCYSCSLIQMLVHLKKNGKYEEIPTAEEVLENSLKKPSTAFDIPALASHMIL